MHIPTCETQKLNVLSFSDALENEKNGSYEYDINKWIYVPNEYVDYYFPVKELASRGDLRIKNIRIDPADFSGVMSEIKAVEFVKIKKKDIWN